MSSLTKEDLHKELEQFARNTIWRQLSEFSKVIQDRMCDELQRISASNLQACRISPPRPLSREPRPLSREPRPLSREPRPLSREQRPLSRGQRPISREPRPLTRDSAHSAQVPGQLPQACFQATNGSAKANKTVTFVQQQTTSTVDFEDLSQEVDDTYTAAREKVATLRLAVGSDAYLGDELRSMGYFHMHGGKSKVHLEVDEGEASQSTSPAKSAKELMLRTAANPDDLIRDNPSIVNMLGFRGKLNNSVIERMVCSHNFEYCMLFLICLNALYIGIESEVTSADLSTIGSPAVRIIDVVFFSIFTIELGLRIFVFRWWFFSCSTPSGNRNQHIGWNLFDFLMVVIQALDIVLREFTSLDGFVLGQIIVFRLLRILRIGRLFRMAKHFRWFRALRIIVTCIFYSIESFVWAIASLQAVTYLFAVYLTEIALTRLQDVPDDLELKQHFGSLTNSWESLLKAIAGGIDWGELIKPLTNAGFFTALLPFLGYVLFTLVVLMNVFTAIFLESASERAKQESEIQLLRNAYLIFKASDHSHSNMIAKHDFQESLTHPDVHQFFSAINLDMQQAEVLFELLDTSNDGLISCDEFLRGCLRLRGTAKALDLLILSREVVALFDGIAEVCKLNAAAVSVTRQMTNQHIRTSEDNNRLLQEIVREHAAVDGTSPPIKNNFKQPAARSQHVADEDVEVIDLSS